MGRETSPTPRRRGPIHVGAAAVALGGLALSAGLARAAVLLAVVALVAAWRLRRPPRRPPAVLFGVGALAVLALAGVAIVAPDAHQDVVSGAVASAAGFAAYVVAVGSDERRREAEIAAFL